jgi:PhnB protein
VTRVRNGHDGVVAKRPESNYEGPGLQAVRPYLIVGDASAAIDFYCRAFDGTELERHTTPQGGIGHAKVRIGETILELGEHDSARQRKAADIPAIGLRLYVLDVDETHRRAIAAGATGTEPTERPPGTRSATIYDPFGLTWWLAATLD